MFLFQILTVRKSSDFATTGRWVLKIKDKSSGSVSEQIFDAVLVCTGHHAEKNMASFPGMDKFQGSIIHSHDYKHPRGYEDKRVVVLGIGNSGGDAAVELSRISSKVSFFTTPLLKLLYPLKLAHQMDCRLLNFSPASISKIAVPWLNGKVLLTQESLVRFPRSTSHSDETLNRCPLLRITFLCLWDVKPSSLTHSLTHSSF